MKTQIKLQRIDTNEDEIKIKEWLVSNKAFVKNGQIICTVETTKAIEDIEADKDGYLIIIKKAGEKARFGTTIGYILDNLDETNSIFLIDKNPSEETFENITKKAIKKAEELGINIKEIKKDGMITEKDIIDFASKKEINIMNSSNKLVHKYDIERVVVIGAGKGAEVVVDILLESKNKLIVGLVDDNIKNFIYYPLPIIYSNIEKFPEEFDKNAYDTVIISIGANFSTLNLRKKIYTDYTAKGIKFTNAISLTAEIRKFTELGDGNIIGSMVYIGTKTYLGNNNLISYGCKIGHHNTIGNHNLFAPGVITSGSVNIGDFCIFGAGVCTQNRLKIGNNVIIPTGYSVFTDIEDNTTIKIGGKT